MYGRFELPPSSDGHRDREDRVKVRGLVLPAVLIVWALVNLVTCQAAWPVMRGRSLSIIWVTDFFRVSLAAGVKAGIAIACFGWYYIANRDEWSYWTQLVTLIGCACAVIAFVVGSLSFLWLGWP